MAIPHFEELAGAIDGVNLVFTASTDYIAGSTRPFVRGRPIEATNDDGYFETSPATGVITFKEAPLSGDDVQMLWLESSATLAEEEVSPLSGLLRDRDDLLGALLELDALAGLLADADGITGDLASDDPLAGQLAADDAITGSITCP